MAKANVILVKEFINEGSSRPASLSEMNEFWKACSEEERNKFAAEVREIAPHLDPVAA